MKDPIHIFLASNDNYAQHLGVTIASILYNAAKEDELNFYILTNQLSDENKKRILNLKKIRKCKIQFIPVEYFSDMPELKGVSKDTYSRLKIPDMFKNLDKALYLDCDIVVKTSLSELWNTDIESYYLGAALDIFNYLANGGFQFAIDRIKIITKSLNNYYFNAGILLMNLKMLREFNFTEKFTKYAQENRETLRYGDQDILNGLFVNKVKFIDQSWNYDQRFKNGLAIEPRIIHYATERKPWIYNDSYFQSDYDNYLKMINWKNSAT